MVFKLPVIEYPFTKMRMEQEKLNYCSCVPNLSIHSFHIVEKSTHPIRDCLPAVVVRTQIK